MVEAAASRLWETSLGQLQLQVTQANYRTWLRDTEGLSFDGETFVVSVPSDFAREWLDSKLKGAAMKTISDVVGKPVDISFVVSGGTPAAAATPLRSPHTSRVPDLQGRNLVLRNTFQSFVVGDANRFASSAARSVAEGASDRFNPLFIYGGVGQGKTHLLHAIGNLMATRGENVLYAPADQFLRDFVMSIQRHGEEEFRQKYRGLDVLLLDDFQLLVGVGKGKTEEEFLHTFNALQNGERQIVITSDRTPKHFTDLSDRLRTRLEGGLCVEIKPPDPQLRVDFLRKRTKDRDIDLALDVIDYLSEHFKLSIRALDGALNQVLGLASVVQRPITVELAMEATAGLASPNHRARPSADRVLGVVCRHFDQTLEGLGSISREKKLTYARQVAMLLLRDECQLALAEVGKLLGGRDHSTVLHGANKIARAEKYDQHIRYDLHEIRLILAEPVREGPEPDRRIQAAR